MRNVASFIWSFRAETARRPSGVTRHGVDRVRAQGDREQGLSRGGNARRSPCRLGLAGSNVAALGLGELKRDSRLYLYRHNFSKRVGLVAVYLTVC